MSVCDNQNDFNVAVKNALKYNVKETEKKMKPYIYVMLVLGVIFLVWAILLAMQVAPGPGRVVHLVFAMMFSPMYVIAYYLGMLQSSEIKMGMCGCSAGTGNY